MGLFSFIFPRRRCFICWLKCLFFISLIWLMVIFVFNRDSESSFGVAVRNRVNLFKNSGLSASDPKVVQKEKRLKLKVSKKRIKDSRKKVSNSDCGKPSTSEEEKTKKPAIKHIMHVLAKGSLDKNFTMKPQAKIVVAKESKESLENKVEIKPMKPQKKIAVAEPTKSKESLEKSVEIKPMKPQKKISVSESITATVPTKLIKATASKKANIAEESFKSYKKFSPPPNIFGVNNLGEMGEAVKMPTNLTKDIKKLYDDGWTNHSFNQYLSDLISVKRTLPDFRTDYCKQTVNYTSNLPATSVIFIFHNEAWSTLLRSVHSVIDRSPPHLITEIILVDDASTMDHLKEPLDEYFKDYPKVKIVRSKLREGLIRARLRGTAVAKGPVLTFLDSHIECTTGWLEPLLDRIAKNPTNVPVPMIDIIDDTTFYLRPHTKLQSVQVGGFDWGLNFRWHTLPDSEKKRKKDPSEPTRSPTMAGGLFSIYKEFFETLGMYDPGFDIWGAENLEISFKIWMCGGTLEILPCSHVGHIFRKKSPYKWRTGVNVVKKNNMRLAQVWLDEYAEYYYLRSGKMDDFGNVSDRVQLRKDLGCKSFKWYLKNVYPEMKIPKDAISYGSIRNLGYGGNMCLDVLAKEKAVAIMYQCTKQGGNQYFEYDEGHIIRDRFTLQYEPPSIIFKNTPMKTKWTFNNETKQIEHRPSNRCLAMNTNLMLLMENCSTMGEGQQWELERLRPDRLKFF